MPILTELFSPLSQRISQIFSGAVIAFVLVSALASPAMAQDAEQNSSGSFWNVVLQGGVFLPLGDLETVYQPGLAGGFRLGWTSSSGLGVDVAAEYSPRTQKSVDGAARADIHFVTAAIMPRFTLGKKTFRVWVAGGGGLSYERTKLSSSTEVISTDQEYALSGIAAMGLEFHPIAGVGIAAIGSYNRTFGDFEYEFVNLTAGLTFTF